MNDEHRDDDAEQLATVAGLTANTVNATHDLPGRGFALTETDTGDKPPAGSPVRLNLQLVTRDDGSTFLQLSLMSPDGHQLYGGAQVAMDDVQQAVMAALATGGVSPFGL